MKVIYITKVIKSKTNNNEFCKQYFAIYGTNENDISLLVNKFVLSSDFVLYKNYSLIKKFKDKGLFHVHYGIKMDTLFKVNNWIEGLLHK